MLDEIKNIVAESCSSYEDIANVRGVLSMSIYGVNCENCSNYKNNKCSKGLLDDMANKIKIN